MNYQTGGRPVGSPRHITLVASAYAHIFQGKDMDLGKNILTLLHISHSSREGEEEKKMSILDE